jgi:hypothetical protein
MLWEVLKLLIELLSLAPVRWLVSGFLLIIITMPAVIFIIWAFRKVLTLRTPWKIVFFSGLVIFSLVNVPEPYSRGVHPLLKGIFTVAPPQELNWKFPEYLPARYEDGRYIPEIHAPEIVKWYNDSLLPMASHVYRFSFRVVLAGIFVPQMWLGILGYLTFLIIIITMIMKALSYFTVSGKDRDDEKKSKT